MKAPSLSGRDLSAGNLKIRTFLPWCSALRTLLTIFFLLGAFLYFFLLVRSSPLNIHDEGYAVYGATRILRGDVPYRDFLVVYPPGQFYLLAGVFKLFGPAILVERILDISIRLLISATIFLISARLTAFHCAAMTSMIAATWLGAAGFYGYAVFPALLFSLISMYCLLLYGSNRQAFLLAIIGVNVGLATLFRLDVGTYLFLAQAPSVALLAFLHAKHVDPPAKNPFIPSLKAGAFFLVGVLAPVLAWFTYLGVKASATTVWSAVVVIPVTRLGDVRHLPLPPILPTLTNNHNTSYADGVWSYLQFPFFFWCPLAIYGVSVFQMTARFLRSSRSPRNTGPSLYLGLPVNVFGLGLFALAQSRADRIHVLPTLIISLIPLALLLFHAVESPMEYAAKGFAWMIMILLILPTASDLYLQKEGIFTAAWSRCSSRPERAQCIPVQPDQGLAVEYIRSVTRPDERIFVGNVRHDRVWINDISFYFLADRHSASRHYDLVPGLVTTSDVQREIIQDLEAHHVVYVVLADQFEGALEPNQSSMSSGVMLLDDFIRAHYKPVVHIGHYTILRRHVRSFATP